MRPSVGEPIYFEIRQVEARTYYAWYFDYSFNINDGSALLVVSLRDGRVIEQSDPMMNDSTDEDEL
jgi:hypothetical protein